ncbi:MAG: GGDEF domain-containing protein [Ramlibacter sp.]
MSSTTQTQIPGQTRKGPGSDTQRARHGGARDTISFTLRRLEPWIAGSIALYTAWIAAAVLNQTVAAWLFVAYAALIARWCQARPAHHQGEVFLRGVALLAGAYGLQTYVQGGTEGPGGLFFFWMSITVLYYAFMLKPGWAMGLVAASVLACLASAWQTGRASWDELAAPLGFLAIFPGVVAMRFGVAMRRPDEVIEQSLLDASTDLYNERGFLAHGGELLAECAGERQPASLVMFDCADLHEVRAIYGSATSRKVLARLIGKLHAIAGERGLVARTAPTEFTLLLPAMNCQKATQAIGRVLGRSGCLEYDVGDSEIVVVPDFIVDAVSLDDGSLGESLAAIRRDLQKRRSLEASRQQYLTRERERHSRPAPLASAAAVTRAAPAPLPARRSHGMLVTPATMPVPLVYTR